MKSLYATIQLLAMLLSTAEADNRHGGAKHTTFPNIKLTPTNEVDPVKGVDFASGKADVTLTSKKRRWQVCIRSSVEGFIPGLLHIHTGKISENGGVVVDFSIMLSKSDPDFYGCVKVTKALFDDIKLNPVRNHCNAAFRSMSLHQISLAKPFCAQFFQDLYYVNAHVAGAPDNVKNLAIRGQIVQAFSTTVLPSEEVSPFVGKDGASGVARIKFESAGTVICVDATIQGFDPVLAHVHNAQPGVNGPVVVDFSGTKVAPGRFLGCITLSVPPEAGQPATIENVVNILDDPSDYYFNFHDGAAQTPDFNIAVRGQLDEI